MAAAWEQGNLRGALSDRVRVAGGPVGVRLDAVCSGGNLFEAVLQAFLVAGVRGQLESLQQAIGGGAGVIQGVVFGGGRVQAREVRVGGGLMLLLLGMRISHDRVVLCAGEGTAAGRKGAGAGAQEDEYEEEVLK